MSVSKIKNRKLFFFFTLYRNPEKINNVKIVQKVGYIYILKQMFCWNKLLLDTWSFSCCTKENTTGNRYETVDNFFNFKHDTCIPFHIRLQTECINCEMLISLWFISIYNDNGFPTIWLFYLCVWCFVFFCTRFVLYLVIRNYHNNCEELRFF